jgi:DNA-binding transcriptional MerR regulator
VPVSPLTNVVIPNRTVFRAQEVCEIAEVQAYVLRTWEAEFPDLGVAKAPNGPRVYRRADVERVLRIKHLILIDGLTLAGARRKLGEEAPATAAGTGVADTEVAALMDGAVTQQLRDVRRGLQWILGVLSDTGVPSSPFVEAVARGGRATAARQDGGAKAAKPDARKAAPERPTRAKAATKARKR